MKIGEQIHKARKSAKMRQGELSDKVDITQSYLSQIESSAKIPSLDLVIRISQVLRENFTIQHDAY